MERSTDPKLRFSLNGRRLPPSCTILQAVQRSKAESQQQAAGSGDAAAVETAAARRARRMWDDVYTLDYTRWDGPDAVDVRPVSSAARSVSPVVSSKKVGTPAALMPTPCTVRGC